MKRLLLTSSVAVTLAAIGSCAGEEDGSTGVVTATATTGPGAPAGGPGSMGTTPVGPVVNNGGAGPVAVGPVVGNGGMPGVTPTPGGGMGPMPTDAVCGNGVHQVGEECDDGNTTPGDGCDAMCNIEVMMQPVAECGNGMQEAGEQCDDGNLVDGDGCEANCTTTAVETCGNGMMDPGEDCDDGNTMSGDGCEANCTVTPAEPECGNGMQEADEACDDGNTMDGDGCEADCTVTPVIQDICGDGEQGDTEECDDGNNEDGDGCDADCRIGEVVSVIPTIEELFPPGNAGPLDGTLRVSGCAEANPNGTDCASDGGYLVSGGTGTKIDCAGALDVQHTYDVAGEPGVTYLVTMHFYGIMEPKNYGQSVQRDAPQRPGNQDSGSDPAPFARASGGHTYPGSDYNTYELHVDNDMDQEVGVYYMNADTSEGHWTYVIDYERQIEVIGGGRIRTRVFDRNCRQIKNCGPANTPANQCSSIANARVINLSGADPAPMNAAANQGGLLQPALVSSRDAGSAGQWWLIDIVSVDSME